VQFKWGIFLWGFAVLLYDVCFVHVRDVRLSCVVWGACCIIHSPLQLHFICIHASDIVYPPPPTSHSSLQTHPFLTKQTTTGA